MLTGLKVKILEMSSNIMDVLSSKIESDTVECGVISGKLWITKEEKAVKIPSLVVNIKYRYRPEATIIIVELFDGYIKMEVVDEIYE